jgi:hypothetical protein
MFDTDRLSWLRMFDTDRLSWLRMFEVFVTLYTNMLGWNLEIGRGHIQLLSSSFITILKFMLVWVQ